MRKKLVGYKTDIKKRLDIEGKIECTGMIDRENFLIKSETALKLLEFFCQFDIFDIW